MTMGPAVSAIAARLVGAVALVAASVCWPAPAQAADHPQLPGEEVETSTDQGAPTDLTAGTWRFDVGDADEPRWFRVPRTIPGSTVHASLLAPASEGDAVDLELTTPDAKSCANVSARAPLSWGALMDAQTRVGPDIDLDDTGTGEDQDPCLAATSLLVSVGRSSLAEGTGRLPVTLRLIEEAPVASLEGLPATEEEPELRAPDVSGEASEAEAASGLLDVPEIGTGIHRGSVSGGESDVRRIALDWGQYALVRVLSPKVGEGVADEFEEGLPDLRLEVRGPLLAEVRTPVDRSLSSSSVTTLETVVGPVRYLRRGDGDAGPHLPGDHFLVVSAEDVEGGALDVDYTLQVEVVGEPEAAPAYTEDSPFLLGDGETARLVRYDAGRSLARTLSAGALAVLGVGSVGAGVVLLRRR